jgi:hypothetical protein
MTYKSLNHRGHEGTHRKNFTECPPWMPASRFETAAK